ncbi:family 43 glycosylhydrolase [Cellulosimicrobium sp. PMB13]|uniref:glycoside hydrolase family 43 protein n=1 Tax=Cellulosimicrobium sp. PMB13 TaxID=3120158 RepID=UPI003F4B9F04
MPDLIAEPDSASLPTLPVLPGFHPDPSVVRVGDLYYLACSSFEYAPGVPVFRSPDLVAWELVGHALDRPSQLALAQAGPSGGIYAPTLRHHDGRFWLVTTNVNDGPGHLLVSATDPAGPWSEPVRIDAGGIDPDLAWDDDGTCYLTWSDGGIVQAELDPTTGELLTAPRTVWQGTGGQHPEGPHLYRVGSWWYLLIAEGGTGHGHAVTVARGSTPSGPFEACPDNPVLTARGTRSPVQNTGHADLVQRPDGSWAAVFLGVRPDGRFPGWHVLGRETFAAEVSWVDGWPRVGRALQPHATPAVESTLGDVRLPRDWVAASAFPGDVLTWSDGAWRLVPRAADDRSFVGRRQEHRVSSARARVDASEGVGGLELRVDPEHAVTLEVAGDVVRVVARIGPAVSVLAEAVTTTGAELELRTQASTAHEYSHRRGPDEVVAVLHGADGPRELARVDGRYLSTEVAGGFTGRMVGLSCASGRVTVEAFRYSGSAEPAPLA